MRLATFTHPETGEVHRTGVLHEQLVIDPLGTLFSSFGGGPNAASRAASRRRAI